MSRWMAVTIHVAEDGDPEEVADAIDERPEEFDLGFVETWQGNVRVDTQYGIGSVSVSDMLSAAGDDAVSAAAVEANDTTYRGTGYFYEATRRGASRTDKIGGVEQEGDNGSVVASKLREKHDKPVATPMDGIPAFHPDRR